MVNFVALTKMVPNTHSTQVSHTRDRIAAVDSVEAVIAGACVAVKTSVRTVSLHTRV